MPEPLKYRESQKTAIKFLLAHRNAGLLQGPGMGKTVAGLRAWQLRRKAGTAKKLLVFAPRRVVYNVWSRTNPESDLCKWSEFQGIKVTVLHGRHKEDALESDADLYVINFEGIPWLFQKASPTSQRAPRFEKLLAHGVNALIVDELSKFRHTNTQRYKLVKPHLKEFAIRWGFTGSPRARHCIDLFGQAYTLDLGQTFGPYITHFREQFFYPSGFKGYEWSPKPGAEEQIYEKLKPLCLAMRTEDYIEGLPELVENNIWVDLPDEVRAFYEALEDELAAQFNGQEFIATSAATLANKCRQIASGGLYRTEVNQYGKLLRGDPEHLHDAKTEALQELLEELQGAQLFIGYDFHHDLARIRKALGDVPSLGGGISDKRADEIIAAWNAGELEVLAGHPLSAAHGLNMQKSCAAHVCWYTPPWDQELYDQFIRRVLRPGNTVKQVFSHRIVARNTVDTTVLQSLSSKTRGQAALFEALKAYLPSRKK